MLSIYLPINLICCQKQKNPTTEQGTKPAKKETICRSFHSFFERGGAKTHHFPSKHAYLSMRTCFFVFLKKKPTFLQWNYSSHWPWWYCFFFSFFVSHFLKHKHQCQINKTNAKTKTASLLSLFFLFAWKLKQKAQCMLLPSPTLCSFKLYIFIK